MCDADGEYGYLSAPLDHEAHHQRNQSAGGGLANVMPIRKLGFGPRQRPSRCLRTHKQIHPRHVLNHMLTSQVATAYTPHAPSVLPSALASYTASSYLHPAVFGPARLQSRCPPEILIPRKHATFTHGHVDRGFRI